MPKQWWSTIAFRRFRQKHTSLYLIYWTSEVARWALLETLKGKSSMAHAITELGMPVDVRFLPETVDQVTKAVPGRAGVERLHLLMICSANLESYLQEAVRLFVAAQGHAAKANMLTPVGKAIARPILNSSTVPDMLEYAEDLLGLAFGQNRTIWRRGYKLRCEAAHEGGVVTAGTLREIPDLRKCFRLGDQITLTWAELNDCLRAAYEIAEAVDMKISRGRLRLLEIEWHLAALKEEKMLPLKSEVWKYVHLLGVPKVQKSEKRRIEAAVY